MLDRYVLYQIQDLSSRFDVPSGVPRGVKRQYNVRPTMEMPVVVERDGNRYIEKKMWGFVTQGAKDVNGVFRHKSFNARSEHAFTKKMWQHSIRTQRCIVPMNGYYEWQETPDGKRAFYMSPEDSQLIGVAGLYSSWVSPDLVEHATFTILTVDDGFAENKPTRRPIALLSTQESAWLRTDNQDMSSIYGCINVDNTLAMVRREVSASVWSPKANGEELIRPIK